MDSSNASYAYALNQHLRTTDTPTFSALTLNGNAYANEFVTPNNSSYGLRNMAGNAWIHINESGSSGGTGGYVFVRSMGDYYQDATTHYFRSQDGGTLFARLSSAGLYAQGNFITPAGTSNGLQNDAGTAWLRIDDGGRNTHLYNNASGNIYEDANAHYFRSSGGVTQATLDSNALTIANSLKIVNGTNTLRSYDDKTSLSLGTSSSAQKLLKTGSVRLAAGEAMEIGRFITSAPATNGSLSAKLRITADHIGARGEYNFLMNLYRKIQLVQTWTVCNLLRRTEMEVFM